MLQWFKLFIKLFIIIEFVYLILIRLTIKDYDDRFDTPLLLVGLLVSIALSYTIHLIMKENKS